MTRPFSYGLPHDEWRPGQLETVEWIARTRKQSLIVQAPTGSGKSAVASALARYGSVRSLTHTIYLQDQYADIYDFEPLYGMGNYPCAAWQNQVQADQCLHSENMWHCPYKLDCQYLIRRKIVSESDKQSLSYAYFLAANWVKQEFTDFIYLDEAHLIPEIVKNHAKVEYTPMYLHYNDLPHYPDIHVSNSNARVKLSLGWLNSVLLEMKLETQRLKDKNPPRWRTPKIAKKIKALDSEILVLERTINWADLHPDHFYCDWDEEKYQLIPLTARLHFRDLFLNKFPHKAILTSATIGNPNSLRRELGLLEHTVDFRDVPSAFPPESMPVFVYSDAPKLNHRSNHHDWRQWAKIIYDIINDCDPSWSGIVHVSSARQAVSLAETLVRYGLDSDRVYIPEGIGTGKKIEHWQLRKLKYPNTICITYSFHMGLDAGDDEINIIGKIPFATLDGYGMALLNYDSGIYQHNAAVLTEQAAGRIRRGRPEHYEESGEPMRKLVAIVDNNYIRLMDEFSEHFKNCIYPI